MPKVIFETIPQTNATGYPPSYAREVEGRWYRRLGPATGVRDAGLLDSAMARAQNLHAYGNPDAASLAAAYAFGIARNHPFIDGKKRTATVVAETFLAFNGYWLNATDAELVVAILALAAGELSESELADWFRDHLTVD